MMRIAKLGLATVLVLQVSCTGDFVANQTEERSGNVSVQFINSTPFRASFSFGSYDSLDRDPPGPVTLMQSRLEGLTNSAPVQLTCRRDVSIGTDEFLQRVLDTNADNTANFDAEAFSSMVNFSSAASDSDAAALPTEGTALGRNVRLGVDYTCGDLLIFTFTQDAVRPGGFRIDFSVVPDVEADR